MMAGMGVLMHRRSWIFGTRGGDFLTATSGGKFTGNRKDMPLSEVCFVGIRGDCPALVGFLICELY